MQADSLSEEQVSEFKEAFSLFVSVSLSACSVDSSRIVDVLLTSARRTKMAMVCPFSPATLVAKTNSTLGG